MTGLSSLDNALQDFQSFHAYRHDIFISYSTRQEPAALGVARGLAVIEQYQPDSLAPLLRIQAVCLQAVGRAAEAQEVAARAMQKEPAYSLAEERVNTYYENDDELERWLVALAAAGFSYNAPGHKLRIPQA